jgi:hypothetical protein
MKATAKMVAENAATERLMLLALRRIAVRRLLASDLALSCSGVESDDPGLGDGSRGLTVAPIALGCLPAQCPARVSEFA